MAEAMTPRSVLRRVRGNGMPRWGAAVFSLAVMMNTGSCCRCGDGGAQRQCCQVGISRVVPARAGGMAGPWRGRGRCLALLEGAAVATVSRSCAGASCSSVRPRRECKGRQQPCCWVGRRGGGCQVEDSVTAWVRTSARHSGCSRRCPNLSSS